MTRLALLTVFLALALRAGAAMAADVTVTVDQIESAQGKGTTFQHTFTATGDVNYVCTIHQGMKGVIKVVS